MGMTISQIDQAISSFVNYIEARYERVIGGASAVEVSVTENGIFLKYGCPEHSHSYSTKVDMMSPNFISEVKVDVDIIRYHSLQKIITNVF